MKKVVKLLSDESLIFSLVSLLNILPLFLFRYFPTMDGPSHLYNSTIILEMFLNPESIYNSYFTFNPLIVNWLHHVILSPLQLFLPPFISEKILIGVYIVGLAYSFRSLVKIYSHNKWASFLIFPFIYNFLFILGFYNYCLSLIILFVTIRQFLLLYQQLSIRKIIVFFLLTMILYYSHLFVFILLCISIGCILFWNFIHDIFFKSKPYKETIKHTFQIALISLGSAAFGIFHIVQFFFSRTNGGSIESLDKYGFGQLIEWLINIRPVIAYNYNYEQKFTYVLSFSYMVIVAGIVISRFREYKLKNQLLINKSDGFFLISVVLFILYLIIPNYISGIGGHITIRIAIPMFLFFILWLSFSKCNAWIFRTGVIVSIIVSLVLLNRYKSTLGKLNKDAIIIEKLGTNISENSTVLSIDNSGNWIQNHFSNYLGLNHSMVLLENYEASSGSFPLIWNINALSDLKLASDSTMPECILKWSDGEGHSKTIDYVFCWGEVDSLIYNNCISSGYELVNSLESTYSLFQFKSKIENTY